MNWALEGVKVIDLTGYIAGSYAAMMLADLGAEVIKVESLEGDSFRELPGFFGWNRGKRSISVNLKEGDGLAIVHRLATRAGVMALQGFGGPPQYVRIAITDYYAAALACQGVLAALYVRERTGRGQRVETSLAHAVLALQSGNVADFPGRPSVFRDNPIYRLYQAGDGQYFFLACGNQSFWLNLCEALGRPDLAADPRFGSWLSRLDHREALIPVLEATFKTKPCDEWLALLTSHDIPCARIQTLKEFMAGPFVAHHGMARRYEHPEVGPLTLMGLPISLSDTPGRDGGPPPTLGQHTADVLKELGYSAAAIEDLAARGIIKGETL